MKDQLPIADEDEHNSSEAAWCWWRSAAKFEELAKFKLEMPNLSKITPRIKVLREMERLALIAPEGLDELRHKLLAYRSGDFWMPTGGIRKEEMDIPPVVTLLLVGFHNSGKSSLVNLMYSVLGRSGLIPFAQTSSEDFIFGGAQCVEVDAKWILCVRHEGFEYDRVDESLEELSEWITDGVHHNQLCLRSGDRLSSSKDELGINFLRSSSQFANRRVNYVMVVANVAEIYKALKASDSNPLEALRQLFCSPALRKRNEDPILILTHGDKLSMEDRIDGRLKICEYLGIMETTGVYDIVCITEYGLLAEEFDPISAYALTEAVYRALLMSDRSHLPKRRIWDWAVLVLSFFMCCLGAFFAFLAHFFNKLGQRDKLKL
ncbi:unnamed protein product [Ilex paraguariensis]|uniref:G domain-containing protein n=1 Tax=Ilex paraguariensis TaxID=185542 RepID=A0ABC8TW82_9AQUA